MRCRTRRRRERDRRIPPPERRRALDVGGNHRRLGDRGAPCADEPAPRLADRPFPRDDLDVDAQKPLPGLDRAPGGARPRAPRGGGPPPPPPPAPPPPRS